MNNRFLQTSLDLLHEEDSHSRVFYWTWNIGSFSWKRTSEVFKCICIWSFWTFFLISTPAYSKHTLSKIHKWSLCLSQTCIWAFPYLFFIIQANLWNVNWPNAHLPKIMRRWISTSAFRCVSSRSRLFFSSMHPLCGQQNHITLTATERQFI